jgi:mono/diheme cytochrome c family protein
LYICKLQKNSIKGEYKMKKFFKIIGVLLIIIILGLTGLYIYLQVAFPKVSPPPDLKVETTQERLERGKYLVTHVTGCIDCHSQHNFDNFSIPVKPGTEGMGGEVFDENLGFPGTFYSKNITPSGIGKWTDGELFRAITSGVNKDGDALFPTMPYLNFGKLDKEDIYSIMAYIRTLKPIPNEVPKSSANFPMSIIIKTIPEDGTFSKRPDKFDKVNYGKYLVTAGDCNTCHTQQKKGKPIEGMEFAGGFEFILPGGIIVRSANLTPENETGLGTWTKEQFVQKFKSFDNSEAKNIKVKAGELNTIMPWTGFAGMTVEDLESIYDYLRTLKPVKNKVVKLGIQGVN